MQQLNPSEISEIIKSRIAKLDTSTEARNEGTVVSVFDGIVRIHGLADVMFGEMIEFEGGIYGMALNLEQDSVGAVVLGDYLGLAEGQKVWLADGSSWPWRDVEPGTQLLGGARARRGPGEADMRPTPCLDMCASSSAAATTASVLALVAAAGVVMSLS